MVQVVVKFVCTQSLSTINHLSGRQFGPILRDRNPTGTPLRGHWTIGTCVESVAIQKVTQLSLEEPLF